MKTENQVFAALCDLLEAARTTVGITATGTNAWPVLARNQQNIVNEDRVILVDKITQRRKGFQNERYEVNASTGLLEKHWEWIEEYRFQVSVVRQREIADTPTTETADEVAALLRAWVNSSEGAAAMRAQGLAPLFVFDLVSSSYQDENGVYQYYSHFDMSVQVVQDKTFSADPITEVHGAEVHVPQCPHDPASAEYRKVYPNTESE